MEHNRNSVKKSGAPSWATAAFHRFAKQIERLHQVVHLSIRGISGLRAVPRLVEALAKVDNTLDREHSKKTLALAHETAELAKREIESGFPVLHSQAVVNLWSLLEALIHSFLCDWILNTPDSLFLKPVQKLKIKIGDYERLERKERVSYVVELLENELGAGLRNGVNRFEAILNPFGFSGRVSARDRRDIYELAQVRNLVAHRAGIVDQQFIDACPWVKSPHEEELLVSHEMLKRYSDAVQRYVIALICHVGERHGSDMSDVRKSIHKRRTHKRPPPKSLKRANQM